MSSFKHLNLDLLLFKSRELVATGTLLAEPYHNWTEEAVFLEETTSREETPLNYAPWQHLVSGTLCLPFRTVAGVHQDRRLTEPLQDTENQTDVGMEREGPGPMMSTECQVIGLHCPH